MKSKQLTVWEAACIITGYGIGGGVMAMPYLAAKNGIFASLIILILAFGASYLLHMMIAEVARGCGAGSQIVSIFSRFLFRGRGKAVMTVAFFVLMAVVLVTNLTAYIVGAAEILAELLGISLLACEILFYVAAASVVIFGLKAVGISEKWTVAVIFGLVGVLAVASFIKPSNPLPLAPSGLKDGVAYFAMAMLSFAAFFSIPQAVEGLGGDEKKIKKAVLLGLGNNFILIIVITAASLLASAEVTEVGMVGWSRGIGAWAQIIGGVFTVLAMLTTYWSISLALSGIVEEQLKFNSRLCWLLATLPSLVLTLIGIGGFIDFLELAGGAIAIIVAVMVVPTYRNARRELPDSMLGKWGSGPMQIVTVIAYLLMAIGSVI